MTWVNLCAWNIFVAFHAKIRIRHVKNIHFATILLRILNMQYCFGWNCYVYTLLLSIVEASTFFYPSTGSSSVFFLLSFCPSMLVYCDHLHWCRLTICHRVSTGSFMLPIFLSNSVSAPHYHFTAAFSSIKTIWTKLLNIHCSILLSL